VPAGEQGERPRRGGARSFEVPVGVVAVGDAGVSGDGGGGAGPGTAGERVRTRECSPWIPWWQPMR
jgi:hypothetical protein